MNDLASASVDEEPSARVGLSLNAKWRLDALIGTGGMGAVYAATHRNGWRAAVKVLHPWYARIPRARARFMREGTIANAVAHPARVAVLDDDITDRGEPFLVMELLEGETLSGRLRQRGGRLAPIDALRIFDAVLDLLAACHAGGIVHRDIKPANVFITRSRQVKVLDFGVARLHDERGPAETTRDGIALGTATYMAPEQAIAAARIDGRADLFAVGACLFRVLSGRRIHEARSESEALALAATCRAARFATVAPHLPAELAAFIDKALVFDPAGRFQTARAMQLELRLLTAAIEAGVLPIDDDTASAEAAADGATLAAEECAEVTVEVPWPSYQAVVAEGSGPQESLPRKASHTRLRSGCRSTIPPTGT